MRGIRIKKEFSLSVFDFFARLLVIKSEDFKFIFLTIWVIAFKFSMVCRCRE